MVIKLKLRDLWHLCYAMVILLFFQVISQLCDLSFLNFFHFVLLFCSRGLLNSRLNVYKKQGNFVSMEQILQVKKKLLNKKLRVPV